MGATAFAGTRHSARTNRPVGTAPYNRSLHLPAGDPKIGRSFNLLAGGKGTAEVSDIPCHSQRGCRMTAPAKADGRAMIGPSARATSRGSEPVAVFRRPYQITALHHKVLSMRLNERCGDLHH